MKKTISGILCMLTLLILTHSCRKDYAQEHFNEDNNPVKPDLTVKVLTDVSGFVIDENDAPVFNAVILAGNKSGKTDEYGYFRITDASLPEIAGFIKVSKTGYFPGYKTFLTEEDGETFTRIKLLPQNNPGDIDASAGGTIEIGNGARLSLPSNAVVVASSGATYTGVVNVAAHWIDPSNMEAAQLQRPGDTRGTDDKDHLRLLNIFSTLAVELTSSTGQLLQIASGKQAAITMPVPSNMIGTAPATIDLWSFDETNGLWKQEGTATKNGNNYTATVSHFSFWSGATGISLVEFSAQIVNSTLQPLANVAVAIRRSSEPFNAGYGRFGFTDANGFITGSIPANSQLVLNVLTPCETEAYSHSFSTTGSDLDMGTLTGNLGQGMVTITGNAVKCNGQPITNGYVQVYDNGFRNKVNIVNGSFSFTGLACTNIVASYVAVDADDHQQSIPQTVTLAAGTNNLGTINACGTSTVGTISITIDGVTTVITEPTDELLTVFNPLSGGWTNVIKINGSPEFNFAFSGAASTTGSHEVAEIFSTLFPTGRVLATPSLAVNVTEYGLAGGFIAGSFSGPMTDFPSGATHTVNCQFRTRRLQ